MSYDEVMLSYTGKTTDAAAIIHSSSAWLRILIMTLKKGYTDFRYVHLFSQSKLVEMLRFFVPLVKNGEALMNLIKILIEGRQLSQPH